MAFPDIYTDYWEYTYPYRDNPNIGLCLAGKFPKSRFLSFTVYNDETQISVSSIEGTNIQPDDSSINPYVKEIDDYEVNGYTTYITPINTPTSVRTSMENVYEFPENVSMISTSMRLYLAKQYSSDKYGGVDMSATRVFDVTTGEEVDSPKCEKCSIHKSLQLPPMNLPVDMKQPPLMRASLNLMHPNSPAEYLFARIRSNGGEVVTFHLIPPATPKSVGEYATADVRYQSIFLGSAKFYSYVSIYDEETPGVDKEGFATFIIADANSVKPPDLQVKAEANDGTYIPTQNRKKQGGGILALYRDTVINEDYPHSMRKLMESIPLAAASSNMGDPNPVIMLARLAMGNWGPQRNKSIEDEYLSDNFNHDSIREQDRPIDQWFITKAPYIRFMPEQGAFFLQTGRNIISDL